MKRLLLPALLLSAVVCGSGSAAPVVGFDMDCFAPAGDPAPGTPAWAQRDAMNQYCASLRPRDQLSEIQAG